MIGVTTNFRLPIPQWVKLLVLSSEGLRSNKNYSWYKSITEDLAEVRR